MQPSCFLVPAWCLLGAHVLIRGSAHVLTTIACVSWRQAARRHLVRVRARARARVRVLGSGRFRVRVRARVWVRLGLAAARRHRF